VGPTYPTVRPFGAGDQKSVGWEKNVGAPNTEGKGVEKTQTHDSRRFANVWRDYGRQVPERKRVATVKRGNCCQKSVKADHNQPRRSKKQRLNTGGGKKKKKQKRGLGSNTKKTQKKKKKKKTQTEKENKNTIAAQKKRCRRGTSQMGNTTGSEQKIQRLAAAANTRTIRNQVANQRQVMKKKWTC